ncbi:MAG: CsgG/HfaB family protein [Candidatus Anammoxibacter sp.]
MKQKRVVMVKVLMFLGVIIMFSGIRSITGFCGIMQSQKLTSSTPHSLEEARTQAYGSKPTIAVMEFKNKTGSDANYSLFGGVQKTFGSGMKEQLVTALAQTNAFILVERQAIKDILSEQDFGASGRVKGNTASAIGEIEGANYLIYGAITEYQGGQGSLGGGLGLGSILGGIVAKMKQDHVAIDIRIVDSRSGRILNATSIEGKSRDFAAGFGGMFGGVLGGIGGSYKNPLQKAVRACMIKAVNWIADNLMVKPAYAGTRPVQGNTQPVAQPVSATNQPPPPKQQSGGGLEGRLMTLKRLKDNGLITEKEYKDRKQEILKEY